MKRLSHRLLRFFISWGFLKFLLIVITLVVLLYAEEDWRGARDLAAAKARWQAAGLSLDPADYYPPPVPDGQNLAALPVFRLEPDPQLMGEIAPARLFDATAENKHGGDLVDSEKKLHLPELVASAYAKMFPDKTPPKNLAAQLEELYPIIVDLRNWAATRPAFRLNQDYAHQPPWDRPLGLVTGQIGVAKLLRYHAELALRENQPQIALDDIHIGFRIARGAGQDPSLVGGLVTLGVVAITRANLDVGLKNQVWSDAQLAQLQDKLKQIDFLRLYQFDMRAEAVMLSLPMDERLKTRPSDMKLIIGMGMGSQAEYDSWLGAVWLWPIWARGWWDMNSAQSASLMLRKSECVDSKTRSVDLKLDQQLTEELEQNRKSLRGVAPWNVLYYMTTSSLSGVLRKFVQGCVQVDEDRIVCGLERYRLAHAAYPPNLDALMPACLDDLPRDIVNGEPYHYRLNPDGTFLLYSVGWNQVDDGGKVVYKPENSNYIDMDHGDWVWPMVKW